ncbi:MAG TPA: response regulator [Holophagaceae bacterium]|nr:response regulator [Holophagaceae bacterium]
MGRLLLVEDHPFNAEAMQRLLAKKGGHEVRVAHDGTAALALARDWRPDLALLDLGLPGMSGLELAQRLKADPATAGIPLLALTASVDPEDHRAARGAGCVGVETKPLELERILSLIARLLSPGS